MPCAQASSVPAPEAVIAGDCRKAVGDFSRSQEISPNQDRQYRQIASVPDT
jgi:hypothetical protein